MESNMPKELEDFFESEYCTLGTIYDVPCTLAAIGDKTEKRRIINKETFKRFSYNTLLYISKLKTPVKTLRNFTSGLISVYNIKE